MGVHFQRPQGGEESLLLGKPDRTEVQYVRAASPQRCGIEYMKTASSVACEEEHETVFEVGFKDAATRAVYIVWWT